MLTQQDLSYDRSFSNEELRSLWAEKSQKEEEGSFVDAMWDFLDDIFNGSEPEFLTDNQHIPNIPLATCYAFKKAYGAAQKVGGAEGITPNMERIVNIPFLIRVLVSKSLTDNDIENVERVIKNAIIEGYNSQHVVASGSVSKIVTTEELATCVYISPNNYNIPGWREGLVVHVGVDYEEVDTQPKPKLGKTAVTRRTIRGGAQSKESNFTRPQSSEKKKESSILPDLFNVTRRTGKK